MKHFCIKLHHLLYAVTTFYCSKLQLNFRAGKDITQLERKQFFLPNDNTTFLTSFTKHFLLCLDIFVLHFF